MSRHDCTEFLQWALPKMRMRWQGFRRVRSQVCKRIGRRIGELQLDGFAAYRERLGSDPGEWTHLDALCRVTISRFWRDREVYDAFARELLPALAGRARARGADRLRCWSCGCASGEEPYSLVMAWRAHGATLFPSVALELVATDSDPLLLERARRGLFDEGSLRDLPEGLRSSYVRAVAEGFRVTAEIRSAVDWRQQDVRRQAGGSRMSAVRSPAATSTWCFAATSPSPITPSRCSSRCCAGWWRRSNRKGRS
jgi:chemotaxis protein methyltransferase CheR